MMDARGRAPDQAAWRVVVFTVFPGGMVYRLVDEVLRASGGRVVGVVTSPGPVRRRSLVYQEVVAAVRPEVDVLISNHPERWAAMLTPLAPDLIICGGFPWRIPADVVALATHGAINLHDGLLPRHRGPNAMGWVFRNDEPEAGFTIHRLGPEFDTGPILAQGRVPIGDDDDIASIGAAFGQLIPDLLRLALARVAAGDPGDPQDERQATYAGLFEDEWRTIDWNRPARAIHNQVRGWVGLRDIPRGATGEVAGQLLQITKTRLLPDQDASAGVVPSGTVLHRDQASIIVQCADAPLALVEWNLATVSNERRSAP